MKPRSVKRFIKTTALLLILGSSPQQAHAEGEPTGVDLWKKLIAEGDAALEAEHHPVPSSVPMADLVWNNGTPAHGFFIELPSTKALVVSLPYGRLIKSMKWQGREFKPGALILRRLSGYDSLWVFQAPAFLKLPPCPVKKSPLPLMRETTELVVVTGTGPCDALFRRRSFPGGMFLPGQPDLSTKRTTLSPLEYANVRPGDPLFVKQNGALIGILTEVQDPVLPGDPPYGFPFLLNFQSPPKLPGASLTHVWGLPVTANPQEDDRFFKEVLPLRATQDKLGESMDDVLKRNTYLGRLTDRPFLDSAHREDLGMEWSLESRVIVQEKGVVTRIEYESSSNGESSPTFIFRWLSSKFGVPTEFYRNGNGPLMSCEALWTIGQAKITFYAALHSAQYPLQLALDIYGPSRREEPYVNHKAFKPVAGNLSDMQNIFQQVEASSVYKALTSPFMDDPSNAGR